MSAMRSPSCTVCSGATCSSRTTPGISVTTGISIFIDSRMAISSPSATIWPSSTTTCHTLAAISARISCMARKLDRQHAVLAGRPVDPLVGADAETASDRGAGLGGVDHVVELGVAGGDVGVDVGADLLGQLESLRGALGFVVDRFERPAVDDVDRAVGSHDRDLGRRPGD